MTTTQWLAPGEVVVLNPQSRSGLVRPTPAGRMVPAATPGRWPASVGQELASNPATAALGRLLDRLAKSSDSGDVRSPRLACWQPAGLWNARRWHRVPWKVFLTLTPLDDATGTPTGDAVKVAARDLSFCGTSFIHAAPLPSRQVLLRHEGDADEPLAFVVTLRWCRFTRAGHYQSGGQFASVSLTDP